MRLARSSATALSARLLLLDQMAAPKYSSQFDTISTHSARSKKLFPHTHLLIPTHGSIVLRGTHKLTL
jgi:hypothetical protein